MTEEECLALKGMPENREGTTYVTDIVGEYFSNDILYAVVAAVD